MEQLLTAATEYLSAVQQMECSEEYKQHILQTADILEQVRDSVVLEETSESFQNLYQALHSTIGPYMSQLYYDTGYNEYNAGNWAEAIEVLEKSVEFNPDNGDPYYILGHCYRLTENKELAIAAYEKFVELMPLRDRANTARRYIADLSGQ